MSVRREVVTLSQLLRRNENSNSRRGAGRAPPLPLQRSRRQSNSAPFTEMPGTQRQQQPLSFTQQLRDANRVASSQAEVGASQTSSAALSQEVYDPECEQLSAITSMSQSSFSQTQSQNLLGSSQDDHLQRLQQWQAQHALPPVPPSPAHCNLSEKLQELEKNLTKALVEQTYQQKQQQQVSMERLAKPINESVEEIKGILATSSDDLKKQRSSLEKLTDDVKGVVVAATDLRKQNLENSEACEETRKAVATEASAVKIALTELQVRIETVEDSVKSCSDRISRVLEEGRSNHEAVLSTVVASSCNCPEEGLPGVKLAESSSGSGRAIGKRRRSPFRCDVAGRKPARYSSTPSIDDSPQRIRAQFSSRNQVENSAWQEEEVDSNGLHHALERIQSLRCKRRSYQYTR